VSYSVTGALLDRLRQGVVELMRDLEREDRLKLVLFNMRVMRTTGFSRDPAVVERAIRGAKAGGGTALLDAISVTLVAAADPDRRQLVVFFTDGSDNSSTSTADAVTAVARRTRATLAFVVPGITRTQTVLTRSYGSVPLPATVTQSTTAAGLPPMLSALAADTGGSVLPVGPSTNLSSTFRRVLGDFRSTYVLYFTPRGVEGGGYHRLDVKVKREGTQVHARRGYFGS
jgi:VWFA-related protein